MGRSSGSSGPYGVRRTSGRARMKSERLQESEDFNFLEGGAPMKRSKRVVEEAPLEEKVDCLCGINYDDGLLMIVCERCATWYHAACTGFAQGETPADDWVCGRCASRKQHTAPATNRQPRRGNQRSAPGESVEKLEFELARLEAELEQLKKKDYWELPPDQDQKQQLCEQLGALEPEVLEKIVTVVNERLPGHLQTDENGEVVLDFDKMDGPTFWCMRFRALEFAPGQVAQ